MKIARTKRFKDAFSHLIERDRRNVEKALRLMGTDLRHRSLRVKKMSGTAAIWEARASRSIRITFQIEGDTLILRNVGAHEKTLRNP